MILKNRGLQRWKEEDLGRLGRFGLRGEALMRPRPLRSGSVAHGPSLDREGVRRRHWGETGMIRDGAEKIRLEE